MEVKRLVFMVTLNPSLDIGGTVDQLVVEEKNYIKNELQSPGGNGVNAARIAKRLNLNLIATGFLGGATGEEVGRLIKSERVPSHFITIQGRTRINVTVSHGSTHLQTRLSFPGPTIKPTELKKLLDFLDKKVERGSLVVLGGSVPHGISIAQIRKLILKLKKRGVEIIVDSPAPVLEALISSGPFLIKPNLQEFQSFTNVEVSQLGDVLKLAQTMTNKIPLICISSVEGGALLVSQVAAWFGILTNVKVRSTIGAGDSMVAGMTSKLFELGIVSRKQPCFATRVLEHGDEVLRWGLAAACATLEAEVGHLGARSNIVKCLSRVQIRRVRNIY